MKQLREQVEVQARYIDEVREVKHDMYAHFIVLNHYLSIENYHKAKEYLSKIMQIPIFQKAPYVEVGNDMINALLSAKISQCQSNIILSTTGLFPEDLWIDNMDLCTLFSNLISNSVEACERLVHTEREITLFIEDKPDGMVVNITNPIEENVELEQFEKFTSKEDKTNHGYGLRNIRRIVSKYSGSMSIECVDGLVSIKISLPRLAQRTSL